MVKTINIMSSKTHTKGNVIVEDIKIGDVHYEFEYGICMKSTVVSLPVPKEIDDGILWSWKSKNFITNKIIDYSIHSKYSHYGPNLYDYEAYKVNTYI